MPSCHKSTESDIRGKPEDGREQSKHVNFNFNWMTRSAVKEGSPLDHDDDVHQKLLICYVGQAACCNRLLERYLVDDCGKAGEVEEASGP